MVGKFKVTQDSDQSLSKLYLIGIGLGFFHMGTHTTF